MAVLAPDAIDLIFQALGRLAIIQSLLGNLQSAPSQAAIFDSFATVTDRLDDPLHGLDALYTNQVDILSRLTIMQAAIDAIPTGPQLAGSPVTLPTTPPTGYGADISTVPNDVWSYVLPGGADAGSALSDVYGSAQNLGGLTGVTLPGFPWMEADTLDNWNDITEEGLYPPDRLDASTILPSDASILAWANRTAAGPFGWTNVGWYGTSIPTQNDQNSAKVKWRITMTPAEFAAFKAVPKALNVPPVWPGVAHRTIGTPHALADQLTITAPMDGVSIVIDSTPARLSFWQFDDLRSYRNVGALSFFTDDLDQEPAQSIAFDEGVYTPKHMVRAAGVKIRLTGGVTGTIYPWTITP